MSNAPTIDPLMKAECLKEQAVAIQYKVFAVRMRSDEGTIFMVARSHYDAYKKVKAEPWLYAPDARVRTATHSELQMIAVRALI